MSLFYSLHSGLILLIVVMVITQNMSSDASEGPALKAPIVHATLFPDRICGAVDKEDSYSYTLPS